eukprot:8876688-Alexandrium_andersonii.AAC.1
MGPRLGIVRSLSNRTGHPVNIEPPRSVCESLGLGLAPVDQGHSEPLKLLDLGRHLTCRHRPWRQRLRPHCVPGNHPRRDSGLSRRL